MTYKQQLQCAKRELALRQKCYPGWVNNGRMKPDRAAHELAAMQAIVQTLDKLAGCEDAADDWELNLKDS